MSDLFQMPMFKDLPITGNKRAKTFSDVLREAMTRKGVTPAQVQAATKIPWATLHDWLNKKDTAPKVNANFKKIVRFLGLTLEQILEGANG